MATPRNTMVTVDFFDEVYFRKRPVTARDIEDALARLKECGVEGVAWRLTFLGQAAFRSRVLSPPFLDLEDYRHWSGWMKQRGLKCGLAEEETERRNLVEWLQATLKGIDPLSVASEACRKLGLKLVLWYDLFDGWHTGSYDPFLRERPELCWTDRTGALHLRGVASYAFEENVARLVRVVRECAPYRPDGFYLCCSCHSLHIAEHPEALAEGFGFEEPVVRRYRDRTGDDPRHGDLDRDLLDRIRGEFMTELFGRVRQALDPKAELYLPLQMHPCLVKTSPYWTGPAAIRYFQDTAAWVHQGIAQAVVLGDFEWLFDTWSANWVTKGGHPARPTDQWPIDQLDLLLPGLPWDQLKVYFFSGWLGATESIAKRLASMADAQRRHPGGGGWIHELCSIETADAWDLLRQYVVGEP